jgi:hypothetical protein
VELKDVIMCPTKMYLVFEFLEQDLKSKIDSLSKEILFPASTIKSYMF